MAQALVPHDPVPATPEPNPTPGPALHLGVSSYRDRQGRYAPKDRRGIAIANPLSVEILTVRTGQVVGELQGVEAEGPLSVAPPLPLDPTNMSWTAERLISPVRV